MDKKEREEILKKAYEMGFQYERDYRGCAQCAIAGMCDAMGIKNDVVYKAGSVLSWMPWKWPTAPPAREPRVSTWDAIFSSRIHPWE